MYVFVERWNSLISVFPKCASNNIRRFIHSSLCTFDSDARSKYSSGWDLKVLGEKQATLLTFNDTLILETVRQPKDRFVSAFLSKFVVPDQENLLPRVRLFLSSIGIDRDSLNFQQFVDFILKAPSSREILLSDPHFKPLSELQIQAKGKHVIDMSHVGSKKWLDPIQIRESDLRILDIWSSVYQATYRPIDLHYFSPDIRYMRSADLLRLMQTSGKKPSTHVFHSDELQILIGRFYSQDNTNWASV